MPDNQNQNDSRNPRDFRAPRDARGPRDSRERGSGPRQSSDGKSTHGYSDKPQGLTLTQELIALDEDIIRQIARRAKLVSKMRGGKNHAATPKSIKAEKEVRTAWEAAATRFSRDPRFVRQLFNLLQDLEVQTLAEARALSAFKLAPARKPLDLTWPGPVSGLLSSLWTALAAMRGAPMTLCPVQKSDALNDCVKAFNQSGGQFVWIGPDTLTNQGREPITLAEKSIYAGDDFFNLCLLAFLALNKPGRVRFTGGAGLKSADLSALRHFVPALGARLAHVVPGSNGLPATLECSGVLPASITLPASLPSQALTALLLAALTWEVDITMHFGEVPAEVISAALALVVPLARAAGADAEMRGPSISFFAASLHTEKIPAEPPLIMDPPLATTLLALPFFTGGSIRLTGHWPDSLPDAAEAVSLLRQFGLAVTVGKEHISAAAARPTPFAGIAMDAERLPETLLPLFLSMCAACARRTAGGTPYPHLPEDLDPDLAQDFFAQLGLVEQAGKLIKLEGLEKEAAAAQEHGWTSPGPLWTLAFSLCAFEKPNLRLSNPGSATDIIPYYWAMYNALPTPPLPGSPKKEAEEAAAPKRRRIVAQD